VDKDFAFCLIAIGLDLAVLLSIFSMASYFIARLAWHRRGIVGLLVLILLSQIFWIPLAILTQRPGEFDGFAAYSAWFANWLVTGFALVLLQRKTENIPKSLEDAARLDGLSAIGTWRRAVFPFVRRELAVLAILLLMALLMAGWRFRFAGPDGNIPSLVLFHRIVITQQYFTWITIGSLLGASPLIGLFFLAKRRG
jgi:ABC-type glycerol-3-phosphate transport system permease component